MRIPRPFRRTCRPFVDGDYTEGGRSRYLLHPRFAEHPRHFVRAFLLIQADLLTLMDFVEPADANLATYSHKIHQLLVRTCIEIEANLTAILKENGYRAKGDWSMRDYRLVEHSHRLSSFEIRVPTWRGERGKRRPFAAWSTPTGGLDWYRRYNKAKHNRHRFFCLASFDALIDAVSGLATLLSAQFHQEDYSPNDKSLSVGSEYSYDTDDGMETAIGGFLRVRFPTDWPSSERYDFSWGELAHEQDPFATFDYEPFRMSAP
jgi:hypothetical protein